MPTIKSRVKRRTPQHDTQRKERMTIYNTARWRRLRALKLKDQPLCEVCLSRGVVRQADEVHHLDSFMRYDSKAEQTAKAYSYDNLQSICKQCHQQEHHGKRHEAGFTAKC